MVWHPARDDAGQRVRIKKPSQPSPLTAWTDSSSIAVATPGCHMPAMLNGVAFAPCGPATHPDPWSASSAAFTGGTPRFDCPQHLQPAAGALILEPDGRVWLAGPTNRFGGTWVFPKGRVDPGQGLEATALREVHEELGLYVQLDAFLCDTSRSTTFTRYFTATRVGGNPACCGWETQAAALVPFGRLGHLLTGAHDAPILATFQAHLARLKRPPR